MNGGSILLHLVLNTRNNWIFRFVEWCWM